MSSLSGFLKYSFELKGKGQVSVSHLLLQKPKAHSLCLPSNLLITLCVNLEPLLIRDLLVGLAPGELRGVCHFLAVKLKVDVALLIHTSADLLCAYKGKGRGERTQCPPGSFSREAKWKLVLRWLHHQSYFISTQG